jgi:hypothetical protein
MGLFFLVLYDLLNVFVILVSLSNVVSTDMYNLHEAKVFEALNNV